MSRSYRKTPIFGYSCKESEKDDKRRMNRKIRRRENMKDLLDEGYLPVLKNEAMSEWDMGKDGKHYWPQATKKDMSK